MAHFSRRLHRNYTKACMVEGTVGTWEAVQQHALYKPRGRASYATLVFMRASELFFHTLRDAPTEADFPSHKLLLRAGFIKGLAAGIFDYLPLGLRVKRRLEAVMREEMEAVGFQEVLLPVVQPAELWQRTGRWEAIGDDMARFRDRSERDLCLAMTHEEAMTDLVGSVVTSYRSLPVKLYQLQTKFRDEPRARGGLIRVREFTMKDGYSFHADEAGLDAFYEEVYAAYEAIFRRCGLPVVAVESDNGMMGGSGSHEFMALTPVGEDTLLLCERSDYRANRQVATFQKSVPEAETPGTLERIHTPGTTTIKSLAAFLGVPESRTAKAIFFIADRPGGENEPDGKATPPFVFAVIRGDMELNETKLANAVGARDLRPATPEEIRAVGAEPGYGSPLGVDRERMVVVVDDLIPQSPNLVAGANEAEYHYQNVVYGRDFSADVVTDLVAARAGDSCPVCGALLRAERGVEVGNIFKLGTRYSERMGVTFLSSSGDAKPMVMGSYGIGPGRLMASLVEAHHDEAGIIWPVSVAPFTVILVSLASDRAPEVSSAAEALYKTLREAGIDILFDDRDERPGVKFNDADLLGIPFRLTLGAKSLARGVAELKTRRTGEMQELSLDNLVPSLQEVLEAWEALEAPAPARA